MTDALRSSVLNVPNVATLARLALSIVLFACLAYERFVAGLILFAIAAGTDWFDGFYARRYGQVTQLGRILDPFADKIIICGTFVFLAAVPKSGLAAWMAVAVLARELLVTALRSFLEERGADFSASWSGKLKMVVQCAAVLLSLYRLGWLAPATGDWAAAPPAWLDRAVPLAAWAAVAITIYSGVEYIFAALRLLRAGDARQG